MEIDPERSGCAVKCALIMRFQILSDIHANKFGLEAVLNAGRECEAVLCLGDVVDYGAHPNECCDLLRERAAICLSGNHDAAVAGLIDPACFRPFAQLCVAWTRENLSANNLSWLTTLPPTYHDPELGKRFQLENTPLPHGGLIEMQEPWTHMVNPGSCGQPHDRNIQARYAVFDTETIESLGVRTWPYAPGVPHRERKPAVSQQAFQPLALPTRSLTGQILKQHRRTLLNC